MTTKEDHSPAMKKIMEDYCNSIDADIYNFVLDVINGRDVLANYDSVEWDGGVSKLYKTKDGKKAPQITIKKRIDGTYYVIQVVSDSSKGRNVVSTIYLKKADS